MTENAKNGGRPPPKAMCAMRRCAQQPRAWQCDTTPLTTIVLARKENFNLKFFEKFSMKKLKIKIQEKTSTFSSRISRNTICKN